MATKLATTSAAGAAAANRFLYYEFCHEGYVDGLLPQSYANGWGQAVRFDDNTTEHRTEWKAIAVNSDYTNVLLYNITGDQSESVPLAGKPVGPDRTGDLALGQRLAGRDPAAVAKALAFAIGLFRSEHVENPYWKSSKNVTDRWVPAPNATDDLGSVSDCLCLCLCRRCHLCRLCRRCRRVAAFTRPGWS
jgi:hypothetical protein